MFRAIACILLFFSLVTLSGLGATASALTYPEAGDACCDHGGEPGGVPDRDEPCSAPACLCLFCLSLDRSSPLVYRFLPVGSKFFFAPLRLLYSCAFVSPIEYPPETA